MEFLLGIDLGTSGVKAMLLNARTGDSFVESVSYEVAIPAAGWAEQDPEMWWERLKELLLRLEQQHPDAYRSVMSVGFSGQMHGLVLLDRHGRPLRPAILALDQRSGKQVAEIEETLSRDTLRSVFHNRPFTGFALPSLLWVRDNEPDLLKRTCKALQPKDYIRYRFTGVMDGEFTDASATLAFDIGRREWAFDILAQLRIPREIFPELGESAASSGTVTAQCAAETQLRAGIPVVRGCGDHQAQSIGNGVIREGVFVANIGTSGQVSTFRNRDIYDQELRTHTFCHAFQQAYTVFGAALCSGMSLSWLKDKVLCLEHYAQLNDLAAQAPPGSDGVIYLPYLSGERTPHMDHNACGQFYGLRLGHNRANFIRAVMEGVVYSLKNSLDILVRMGMEPELLIASGGAAKSPHWLQMQADIFEKEITVCETKEQACLGAAILAGVGAKIYPDVPTACDQLVKLNPLTYKPQPENFAAYRHGYAVYNHLYDRTKDLSCLHQEQTIPFAER